MWPFKKKLKKITTAIIPSDPQKTYFVATSCDGQSFDVQCSYRAGRTGTNYLGQIMWFEDALNTYDVAKGVKKSDAIKLLQSRELDLLSTHFNKRTRHQEDFERDVQGFYQNTGRRHWTKACDHVAI